MSSALRKVKNVNKEEYLKRILRNRKKQVRLFLLLSGILFIGLGFYLSGSPKAGIENSNLNNTVSGEVISFSQEPVRVDRSITERQIGRDKTKNPPIRITIPDLSIDLPVKEAKIIKGYWEVFADSAGFGLGSAYPDESGNQVIFAHARRGLFMPLKTAKAGQLVYVLTKDRWFSYKIEEIKEVLPSQIEVIAPTKEPVLTLYTCTGFSDSKRLIVIAKKI